MQDAHTGVKWLSVERLTSLLSNVPGGMQVAVNAVGNLSLRSADKEKYRGYVDFAAEGVVEWEEKYVAIVSFPITETDVSHIREHMEADQKARENVGLKPISDVPEYLSMKVMTDIRTELQTIRALKQSTVTDSQTDRKAT